MRTTQLKNGVPSAANSPKKRKPLRKEGFSCFAESEAWHYRRFAFFAFFAFFFLAIVAFS